MPSRRYFPRAEGGYRYRCGDRVPCRSMTGTGRRPRVRLRGGRWVGRRRSAKGPRLGRRGRRRSHGLYSSARYLLPSRRDEKTCGKGYNTNSGHQSSMPPCHLTGDNSDQSKQSARSSCRSEVGRLSNPAMAPEPAYQAGRRRDRDSASPGMAGSGVQPAARVQGPGSGWCTASGRRAGPR